ncbi:uncharacterized protein LOC144447982 [Glandiceps talaboti]
MEKEDSSSKLYRQDSGDSRESGQPRESKIAATGFSKTVYVILVVQTFVVILVYPVVIATVTLVFQGEIGKLEMAIDHIRTHQQPQQTDMTSAESQGQQTQRACNCPVQTYLGNEDNSNLLQCCVADSQTVRMLINDVLENERRSTSRNRERKRDRTGLNVGEVERLVQAMIKRNDTHVQIPTSTSLGRSIIPVAIHVTAPPTGFHNSPVRGIHNDRGKFKVGPWESNNGQSFSIHIDIDKHHMIVPKSGIYHVYSQAYFRDERVEGERRSLQVNEYLHFTVLDSTMYAVHHTDLMKSGRTQEGQSTSGYYYSSFHSGLFRLRENDKIYMKVYLPNQNVKLDTHQESTFMGMYLVSGDDDE